MSPETDNADAVPWNRLLRDIHKRQVLPVIGPGLVTLEGDGGQAVPFTEKLGPLLAGRLGMDPSMFSSINGAAAAHLVRRRKRSEIYDELRELVEEHDKVAVPRGLADLAAIRDFDLFISSTFDGFMARALVQARPGYRSDASGHAAFHPSKPVDLPEPLPATFLYHVLGDYNTYPDFGVWEEDYMEFLCGLLEAPKDTRRNLFRELRNRKLLLIGAPFDDWIVRFFLRVAKQERLSERRDAAEDYLAEMPAALGAPLIFYFDEVLGSPHIIPASPVAFVRELRQRWEEKYGAGDSTDLWETLPDDMERGSVFISYSRDDTEQAVALALGMKAAGIPVWLDRRNLQAGGDWEQSLKRAVKGRASLFLSLISPATENDPDRFVHEERRWAAEVHVPGDIFYIPVLIDAGMIEGKVTPQREPAIFAHLHRHPLPGGKLTPEFAALLQRYLRQYREHGEVRDG